MHESLAFHGLSFTTPYSTLQTYIKLYLTYHNLAIDTLNPPWPNPRLTLHPTPNFPFYIISLPHMHTTSLPSLISHSSLPCPRLHYYHPILHACTLSTSTLPHLRRLPCLPYLTLYLVPFKMTPLPPVLPHPRLIRLAALPFTLSGVLIGEIN